jgi:hypothetical protein
MLDPDKPSAGFYRSLVLRGSSSGGITPTSVVPVATQPSLASGGTKFAAPTFGPTVLAGEPATLRLPFSVAPGTKFPAGPQLSVRWTPVEQDGTPTATPPDATATPLQPPDATATPVQPPPVANDGDLAPPEIDLVVPEAPDEVVEPQRARLSSGSLGIDVKAPSRPGLYRVVTTIYASDGSAYDSATQSLIPVLLVRVTPALSARYGVVSHLRLVANGSFELPVRLLNSGRLAWGKTPIKGRPVHDVSQPALVARWLSLDGFASDSEAGSAVALVAPGRSAIVTVPISVPQEPGVYLLVVDVDVPGVGPLAARGVEPGMVRVEVIPRAEDRGGARRPAT